MRGNVLGFDAASGSGAIAGEDGRRYTFAASEWRGGEIVPGPGTVIDFDNSNGDAAAAIYPVSRNVATMPGQPMAAGRHYAKSNVAAGLLALFLGSWGIHKFYLGYNSQGITLLIGTIVSFMLTILVVGVFGLMAIGIICLVEAIIYLTKPEAEFNEIYVQNKKPWF